MPASAAAIADRSRSTAAACWRRDSLGLGLAPRRSRAQTARGFTHGVASGEPSAHSVLLWTRYAGAQDAQAALGSVRKRGLRPRRQRRAARPPRPRHDWCAKAVATGLKPGTWYHYRFIAPDGTISAVGRTRTLPDGATDRFRMAVFSCANLGLRLFQLLRPRGARRTHSSSRCTSATISTNTIATPIRPRSSASPAAPPNR